MITIIPSIPSITSFNTANSMAIKHKQICNIRMFQICL